MLRAAAECMLRPTVGKIAKILRFKATIRHRGSCRQRLNEGSRSEGAASWSGVAAMNIATPSATSVRSVSFGTFTEDDIHKLSVIQVTTEKIFDNLQVSFALLADAAR
jgi:hypothetical protein